MDEFEARIRQPLLEKIIALLPQGEPIYLVGGAIRDALLNRPCYDLDFVTSSQAMKTARKLADDLGAAYFPLDSVRKVARIVFPVDDSATMAVSHSMRIDFSAYQGANLDEDLHARDFSMNAMAVDVRRLGAVIDPTGGTADLAAKRLRPCTDQSFIHDPVRLLRAVRFSVDLGLSISTETSKLMHAAVDRLTQVSAERLRDELFRILAVRNPATSIRMLDVLGCLEYILPDVHKLKFVQQSAPHVLDAWEHSLSLLSHLEDLLELLTTSYDEERAGNLNLGLASLSLGRYRDALTVHFDQRLNPDRSVRSLLFLAGLLHDIGKSATRTVDAAGRIRFLDHEQVGSQWVGRQAQELRLSNLETERLVTIVQHHMRPASLAHEPGMPSHKAIYRFFHATGEAGVDICILSLADLMATYGAGLPQDRWQKQLDVVRLLLEAWWDAHDEQVSPQTLLDGNDLMHGLDLPAGPLIGELLEAVREAQVSGELHTRIEALEYARQVLEGERNQKRAES